MPLHLVFLEIFVACPPVRQLKTNEDVDVYACPRLVVGDAFRRLVARACYATFQAVCMDFQLGLSTRAGIEALFKLLQVAHRVLLTHDRAFPSTPLGLLTPSTNANLTRGVRPPYAAAVGRRGLVPADVKVCEQKQG